jgi:hypothetical protein
MNPCADEPALFAWIMKSFGRPGLPGTLIELCERAGRRGLALLSEDERFRHVLAWIWDETLPTLFVRMLNPSKARAIEDDQTMRKIFGFAKRGGYGSVVVINESDFRATDPEDAKRAGWPQSVYCGALLDRVLNDLQDDEDRRDLLCAWGRHGPPLRTWAQGRKRDPRVRLLHLGFTDKGQPAHPCMLPYSRPLTVLATTG